MVHVFIVNPMAGKMDFADQLRDQISKLSDIEYYVFDTRNAGYEAELIQKIQHIFEDEKLRIYCCGGSGTLKNILSGINNLDNVEIAFYPCGMTNDFLKIFNSDDQKRFYNLDELLNGDVIDIDYLKYNDSGIALNTFSTGIDSKFFEKMDEYRFFKTYRLKFPYYFAIIHALFASRTVKCEVSVGNKHYVDDFTEIFFGNGNVLGGIIHIYDNPIVNDGKAKYMLLRSDARRFWSIPVALKMLKRKTREIELIAEYGDEQCMYVRRIDDGPMKYDVDGELVIMGGTVKIEVVRKGLHFVVPKGVTLDDE